MLLFLRLTLALQLSKRFSMSTKKIINGRSQLLTFILELLGAIFDLLVLPYHKALLITSYNQHDDEVTW